MATVLKGFQKGHKPYLLKHTEETKRKISLSHIGVSHKQTEETRRKIGLNGFHYGMLGKKGSKKQKEIASKNWLGENNPNWKGGITNNDRLERLKFRNNMQKIIFERDNYICQICGSGKDLQVDHIQSWAEYVELRFNIENCRTLCMDCHYLITFGKPKPKDVIWGHNLKKVRITP